MEETKEVGASTEEHEHPDFTREYGIITEVIDGLREGRRTAMLDRCRGCEALNRCAIPYADAYALAFSESGMPCTATCDVVDGRHLLRLAHEGEVFMQIVPTSGDALQYCHDEPCNRVLYHQVFEAKRPSSTD